MFCIHCGKALPAEASFCPVCGRKAETSPNTPDETPTAPPAPPPKINCGISLAILAVCVGNVIGIVGLIYAVLASDMLKNGNYEGARRAARTGKIWSWSAIIMAAICFALVLLLVPRYIELLNGLMDNMTEASSI